MALSIPTVSTGTVKNTCIFPQSAAAFMILPASDVLSHHTSRSCQPQIDPEVSLNLKKFDELRHKCYVFVSTPLIGESEQTVLSLLQEEFLSTDLHFLPVHNTTEYTECMLSISKVMCKPLSDVIRGRFERLRDQVCSEESILLILSELGIDERMGTYLLDGCGSLAGVARATRSGELIDYNVESSLIASIEETLNGHSLK